MSADVSAWRSQTRAGLQVVQHDEAPASASLVAMARPMPRPAPVTLQSSLPEKSSCSLLIPYAKRRIYRIYAAARSRMLLCREREGC